MAQTTLNESSLLSGASILSSGPAGLDFEAVYRDASGDAARVPWAEMRPNPFVEEWLNRDACAALRPGARVAIVGCGLGDDVALFADRGYDVLGLDLSPTAVEWARHRFPDHAGRFETADLRTLPTRLARRFDLVVEAYTIQAVPFSVRLPLAAGICSLARPHGAVLAVSFARDEESIPDPASTPPYPLTEHELTDLLGTQGFSPACETLVAPDPERQGELRLRMLFRRSAV
ncbi:MAG: class I SAM-dependent methyltransferase [Phycisphaeraceae bacterium]|nr:class I SAM-dependent methyltransferase [Phycisphaeraceae bacterium]